MKNLLVHVPLAIFLLGCGVSSKETSGSGSGGKNVNADPNAVDSAATNRVAGKLQGIQNCPTVPLEQVAAPPPTALLNASSLFQTTCASCHGAYGEGLGDVPALRTLTNFNLYLKAVRSPKGKMPLFSVEEAPEELLKKDWEAILAATPPAAASSAVRPPWLDWTKEQVDEAYTRGLAAWRKTNVRGMACSGCHAPDGIDLAVIGYNDADVLRRASRFAAPEVALDALDLLHAQRKRYDFAALCDPIKWRPFQPGGQVLGETEESGRPAADDAERATRQSLARSREIAFAKSLVARSLLLASGDVKTLEDAHKARDEMITLNIRKLPIGIPFARYSEDGFHGKDHLAYNDWVPDRGRAAKAGREAELTAAQDAYLAAPTDEAFATYKETIHDLMESDPIFRDPPYAENYGNNFTDQKYSSMLVGQHLFRAELRGQRWDERPERAFGEDALAKRIGNLWFALGDPSGSGNDDVCTKNPNCLGMPPDAAFEMAPNQSAAAKTLAQWWTAGFYFDQSLIEASYRFTEHYWMVFAMDGVYPFHKAFLMTKKFIVQNEVDGKGLNEVTVRGIKGPVIIGEEQWFGWGYAPPDNVHGSDELPELYNHFAPNALRMMVLLYTEKLGQGASVSYKKRILERSAEWRKFLAETAANRVADDTALFDSFDNAVNAAPEVLYEGVDGHRP